MPAPGYSLGLSTNEEGVSQTELAAAQRIITKFANNYFSHQSLPTSLHIYLDLTFQIHVGDTRGFAIYIHYFRVFPTTLRFPFPLFLRIFESAHITSLKSLRLRVAFVLHIYHLSAEILTVMTALEDPELTTRGLIRFIDLLLNGGDYQCSFLHLKNLVWGPDGISEPARGLGHDIFNPEFPVHTAKNGNVR